MSFIDSIALSGKERFHSQVLTWIFSANCTALTNAQKIKILNKLIGRDAITLGSVSSITEYKNIDVTIKAGEHIVIIENKIKSHEHDNQLDKYARIIEGDDIFSADADYCHFIFLTLVDENLPKNSKWIGVRYSQLHIALAEQSLNIINNRNDHIFLQEYISYLGKLTKSLTDFLTNPTQFDHIYEEGKKRKHQIKQNENEELASFILTNQLDTIFMEAFFKNLSTDIGHDNFIISESRGVALIQFVIDDNFHINGKHFQTALQYQGDTLKFNFSVPSSEYSSSKTSDLPPEIINFFKDEKNTIISRDYARCNSPKSKAYISRSKKFKRATEFVDYKEIVSLLSREISAAKNVKLPSQN